MARDVYTADMGMPPSPDEGAKPKKKLGKRPAPDVYTADMGKPPSPDEGPTKKSKSPRPFSAGGKVGSASKRADGIASKGKTKGRVC